MSQTIRREALISLVDTRPAIQQADGDASPFSSVSGDAFRAELERQLAKRVEFYKAETARQIAALYALD